LVGALLVLAACSSSSKGGGQSAAAADDPNAILRIGADIVGSVPWAFDPAAYKASASDEEN
jgi:hypothetical protein